jgi:TRAP transporter TAXI family solute receptor
MNSDATALDSVANKPAWLRSRAWPIAVAGVLLLAGVTAATIYVNYRPTTLQIAVGPAGGDNLRLVQALAQHFARERASVRLRVVVSADDTVESAAAIDRGEVELAVVRGDLPLPQNAQAVAILRRSIVVLIVPAPPAAAPRGRKTRPAQIKKIEQLGGRRVGVVSRTDANITVLNVILTQYEIPTDTVQVITLDPNDVGAAIRDDKVDVLFVPGTLTDKTVADVVAAASNGRAAPTFLALDQSETIEKKFPAYESTEIAAHTFGSSPPRPAEAVKTIGFMHLIVARRKLSEARIGEFARVLYTARQSLASELPALGKIEAPSTDKDAVVPVHPGAAAYIDGEQKTFFDSYSDFLYLGIILLSLLGSVLAGLASHLRADRRADRSKSLERLIALMQSARNGESLAALDALQAEIDEIFASTIREFERHSVEQGMLAAFTLALDQARLAVSERRDMLMVGQVPRVQIAD